ncbi:hypothetical protein [Haloarcula nitratireducens]|uniref:Uncharacterized protein n=1 Tax=Haloarcula nitratireducens TaxID=2487749 RepID=A0AAW4PGA0_9EURY|nr:hypothetical protein [Halomicroarcula nitratireducens]MBX0296767.1 hypothetical protein [Halomicroarcula nitratireducens]
MNTDSERVVPTHIEAATKQLEAALAADDTDSMKYHLRQALQYRYVEAARATPSREIVNEETR